MRKLAVFAALLSLAACSGETSGNGEASTGTASGSAAAESFYRAEIVPILASNCSTCHLTGQEAGNIALIPDKAIESLVGVKAVGAPSMIRVVAGDPDKSYLVMKLEGTHMQNGGAGARMPFGAPPLSADNVAKIRQWIKDGAKP